MIAFLIVAGVIAFFLYKEAGSLLSFGGSGVTPSQIRQYAQNAGFSGSDLDIAVQVAQAESSGDPGAEGDLNNPIGGQYNAFGLWQINTGENPEFAEQNLFDPQTNANAAYRIWLEDGWSAWTTYNSGAYQSHSTGAVNA